MIILKKQAQAVLLSGLMATGGIFAVVGMLSGGNIAHAQTSKGIISGVVRDPSGASVPNVSITVKNEATGETRQVSSSSDGAYRIDAVDPGLYTVLAASPGFAGEQVQHLNVKPSVVTSFDPQLKVGAAATTVTVQAQTNLINTDNAQLSSTLGGPELKNLPIFSLNPVEIAVTLPGVQVVDQGGLSNGFNIQVNGARPRANNFLIDGQDLNDSGIGGQAVQPNIPDIFQSVTVLTNSSSAEYGGAGGGIINYVTRGGTNQFHGTAWELYSGSGLNALDGQLRQGPHTHGAKSRYNQHQAGFTLGGPIIKDKLFGFGAAQYSRYYGNEVGSTLLLPDANGFAVLQSLGAQYPNAKLLQGLLDNGAYLQNFVSFANQGTTTVPLGGGRPDLTLGHYQRPPVPEQNPDTQWTYRVDWLPRQSDTVYIRYLHDRTSLSPDFFTNSTSLPGFDTIQGGPSEQFGGAWTHVFTPHVLNEFRASETRINFTFAFAPETVANPLAHTPTITFSTEYAGGSPGGFPTIGAPSGYPQGRGHDTYQIQDTVSYTRGRQTLRVGANIVRLFVRDLVPFNFYGTLNFQKGGGFSDLGNFIDNYLGPAGSASISFGSNRVDPHTWNQYYFAQDDVKLTPELTANFGVRYEYQQNPENTLRFPGLDPANITAPIDTRLHVNQDRNNIAPRVGLAYAPQGGGYLGAGKTVYHAGFGVFYDGLFTNIVDNSQSSSPNTIAPLAISTQGRGVANAAGVISTLSPTLNPRASVESVVNNLVNPQTFQWNFGFERQLPLNTKLTVNYVGTRGEKLFANQQYNFFDPATQARLIPARGAIIARGNFADSNYNGIETELSHDFTHGLFVRGTYTYSKSLDTGSEVFTTFNQATSYAANLAPGGRAGEYGRSAYDHRNYFAVSYVYAIPGFEQNHVLSAITNHFTVSGDTILQSGPPGTWAISGLDTNGDGSTANDRPDLSNRLAPYSAVGIDGSFVADANGNGGTPGAYYDLAANNASSALVVVDPRNEHFLIPTHSGNVRRDSFNQPGVQYWNLAIQKDIPVQSVTHLEGSSFQIRAEAQDVGNHNNVEPVDINLLDVGGSSFLNTSLQRSNVNNGSLAQGRQLRFWAKFSF